MGPLQLLPIPENKWENIMMDFVQGLPRSKTSCDRNWMLVDRLTKSAHFLPIETNDPTKLARIYVKKIVTLHGALVYVVSNYDTRFISQFWESMQRKMGTALHFSTTLILRPMPNPIG